MTELTGKNIGPIEHITIPVPEKGGVTVFRGVNGCGKTTLLNAIDSAITGKGNVPVRDGATRAEFEGFGITMKVGRSKRRTGELEVHSLESRFSVADLVDPGIAAPDKADAHRIKALVQLAGAKADPALFHELAGGKDAFEKFVTPADLTGDDLVSMSARIKRRFEEAARAEEGQGDHAEGRAKACRDALADVDLERDVDAPALQTAYEKAVLTMQKLLAEQEASQRAREAADSAKREMDAAVASYSRGSFEECDHECDCAFAEQELAQRQVDSLAEQIREAQHVLELRQSAYDAACERREAAKAHEEALVAWKRQIDAAKAAEAISDDQVGEARAAADAARQAVEDGALIRAARQKAQQADEHQAEATEHTKAAERLREAARGTEDVLSSVVASLGLPLRVGVVGHRVRLVTPTVRGEETPFGELSDGERWAIALNLAIRAVGEGGEVTIPQHAWESLDPENRRAIARKLEEGGVIGYTAEASDGELRAEVFEPVCEEH